MADVKVEPTVTTLTAEPLALDEFVPYGRVLGPEGEQWAPGMLADVYSCGLLDADVPVEFLVARAPVRPFTVRFLERHSQLAQTFVPLNSAPFVIVVGRVPDDDRGLPPLHELRAFVVPGDRGITLHKKTWHEAPFPLTESVLLTTSHASLNVALREANQSRTATDAHDVDRRDLAESLGQIVRVALP